jgi:hypothetical protein
VHWSLCSNSLQTAPGREKLFYFISKFRLYSICFLEMNDVDFEEVRSLFQNEGKKGLLVLSEQIFKQINLCPRVTFWRGCETIVLGETIKRRC